MLVLPERKALVLRVREPKQILTLIPTAKQVEVNGVPLVAVPHRLDEARVLSNIGIKAPSPIRYFYDWPGLFKPFSAQIDTAEFLTMNPRAYVLSEMGTGKSMSSLWAYDYLRKIGVVKRALITCPFSTMERTWADEVFNHFPHLRAAVIYGAASRRRELIADRSFDLYIVNHDGLKIITPDLAARDDIDLFIIDEISKVARNASTERWKLINTIANQQVNGRRMVWGLTGTPTPNAPTDAWAQCRIVTPSTVPKYFGRFRDAVMRQAGPYSWLPKPDAMKIVQDAMRPAIRFSRKDCVDLPETIYETRHVCLTPVQNKAYTEMLKKLAFEVASGQVTAVNEAIKVSKLIQIACGVAYDTARNEVILDATPRLDEVADIVESAEGKVLVFVPFVSAIMKVVAHLQEKGVTVGFVHGGVSKTERDDLFRRFQQEADPRVLVAQPMSMSHGLTLVAANTVVWYAPIFSNDVYEQACARVTRPGQTKTTHIIHLEGTPAERAAYKRLSTRQKMQGILLTLVEESRAK